MNEWIYYKQRRIQKEGAAAPINSFKKSRFLSVKGIYKVAQKK